MTVAAAKNAMRRDDITDSLSFVDETMESVSSEQSLGLVDFFKVVFQAKGALQVLLLSFVLSFCVGSTLGVVPGVTSDRYARLHYGYEGPDCSNFDRVDKPASCQSGADEAQNAVAWATLAQNMLTLLSNTMIGSVSDARGRRGIMILSMFLSTLSPAVLVIMQVFQAVDPLVYFSSFALVGLVNFMSVSFAMLSDVIPPHYRAPSFGLFISSYYLGFAGSPSMALVLSHFQVSLLSLFMVIFGFLFACCALPETLDEGIAERNLSRRLAEARHRPDATLRKTIFRPIREMAILNRDYIFRLLTLAFFFSGMVFSSDRSLVIFYIEDQLDVRDGDLAKMMLIMGIVGVIIQGFLIEPLIKCLGEKRLLVLSFLSGTFHNLFYGLARSKELIYVALCLSQLTKTNFPLMSSIASNNVSEREQGRMQGALFALSGLANALGPLSLSVVFNWTKDGGGLGPGTMWVFAAFLYAVGTAIVCFIPAESAKARNEEGNGDENDLEERLLELDDS